MPENTGMSYDSICMLVGRLVLQSHIQNEQLGKTITDLQNALNVEREKSLRLSEELARYVDSAKRVNNQ
jgi:hypothetical protein